MVTKMLDAKRDSPGLFQAVVSASTICTIAVSLIMWLGGKIISPGDRVRELAAQVAHADSLLSDRINLQNLAIVEMRADLLILLTLKCADESVEKIRDRGQYAAAARCAGLVNTGK